MKKAAGPPTTPFLAGEPESLGSYSYEGKQRGYTVRDELLTIQGFVPDVVNLSRKEPTQKLTHFSEISQSTASAQARYFLNAYWPELQPGQAERFYNEWKVFKIIQKEAQIPEDSPAIPQALATLFLQRLKRTVSATEFKTEFAKIDTNFDGHMSFMEYLVWDSKFGSPAAVIYRPQVQHPNLTKAINAVLQAEQAIRANGDTRAEKVAAVEKATGVAATRAKQDLSVFDENNSLAGLNATLASAHNNLAKVRKTLKESGTAFWDERVAAELDSLKSQKQQHKA